MNKKILIIIVIIVVVVALAIPFAIYTISPLFISNTINEPLPTTAAITNKKAASQEYQKFISGDQSGQDVLTEQIIFMLYAIRNNLLHGSKSPGEENDVEVVINALPLLELLVTSFMRS